MPRRLQSPVRAMSRVLFPVLALFVALTVVAPLGANAQTTRSAAASAKRVAPPGYTLRFSASKQAPAATRTRAMVSCPKGTVPLSGGAFVQDADLLLNLSDSFPSGSAWVVDIDNASTAGNEFQVIVTCARKLTHYKVVRARSATLSPGSSKRLFVSCPTGSKPLGGGVSVASIDNSVVGAGVTMAANEPEGRQWLVQESNAGTTNASASAVVVCGSVPKYRVLASREQHVPAQTQLMMKATCPAPTVVMGGGGSVKALSFSVNFAWSTMNEGFDWFLAVNNATDEGIDASAVVICGS